MLQVGFSVADHFDKILKLPFQFDVFYYLQVVDHILNLNYQYHQYLSLPTLNKHHINVKMYIMNNLTILSIVTLFCHKFCFYLDQKDYYKAPILCCLNMYYRCYTTDFDGFDVIIVWLQPYYAVVCMVKGWFVGVQLE